ncbi:hypothetical protein WI23_28745 [Burkholderia oklahomensis C6786]|nr:hypothetical protein WI23_28745 [Burkholderia oklahomensis C6786]KUY57363.1 hypothetical protein WI23_01175 [Burkholderia oklahomensis C6786]
MILSLSIRRSSAPSSAHTYRLFIVKEHICEKHFLLRTAFSAALRCLQQRNEIMITYSQRVNNFFTASPRTAWIFFPLPLSRPVTVTAKEA